MPSYAITLPLAAHRAMQRAWLVLALAAVWPMWAMARALPGFLVVGQHAVIERVPSLWSIVRLVPWIGDLPLAGLAMASAVGAGAWLAALLISRPPRGHALPDAALLIALTMPWLLPTAQMIDFLPAMAFAVACQRRITAFVICGIVLASLGAAPLGALAVAAAMAMTARSFLASPANDNGLPILSVVPVGARPIR